MTKRWTLVLTSVFTFLLILSLLIGRLANLITDEAFMLETMTRVNEPQSLSITMADMETAVKRVCLYLKDELPEFQLFLKSGKEAFNRSEILHMQDVQYLVALAKKVHLSALLWLVGILIAVRKSGKAAQWNETADILGAVCRGNSAAALFLLLIGMFAMVDFRGFFILFHRVLFTNDLWLLNPREDLLLKLMPEPFMLSYVSRACIDAMLIVAAGWLIPRCAAYFVRRKADEH